MFGKNITLFKLFGFEVKIDLSWIVIAVLVTWSLSMGYFPFVYPRLSPVAYWLMGIAGALGLFLSVIAHEFSHSLVAKSFGMPMKGITLFIFGGVAELGEEPPTPRAEFLMAIVGPVTSMVLAALFWGIGSIVSSLGWPQPIGVVFKYLAIINGLLAAFNLLPAFPLDGGRVLRSILWQAKGNLTWATRIASSIGSLFGLLMIGFGFWRMFYGHLFGGMWMALIGIFLQSAAKSSYQQLITREVLRGEPVRRFMKSNPVTVDPSISIEKLIQDYFYHYHYKMFPVVEADRLVGCITTKQVKEVPPQSRSIETVAHLMSQCSLDNCVGPETEAVEALAIMNRSESSRLMVIENDRLVGVITLKDLLQFLSLKMDLEA